MTVRDLRGSLFSDGADGVIGGDGSGDDRRNQVAVQGASSDAPRTRGSPESFGALLAKRSGPDEAALGRCIQAASEVADASVAIEVGTRSWRGMELTIHVLLRFLIV